jgi:putative heme-binding domain-containing protein
VTLRQAFGVDTTVPRAQIKSMRSQGASLMPEGMEEGLKPQDLADLLEFIASAGGDHRGQPAKNPAKNL